MVIDTSAIVAVLRLEAEADTFLRAIATTDACFMSALRAYGFTFAARRYS